MRTNTIGRCMHDVKRRDPSGNVTCVDCGELLFRNDASPVRSAEEALGAIASLVGADPFSPNPRDVYLRVRAMAAERETLRKTCAAIAEAIDAQDRALADAPTP